MGRGHSKELLHDCPHRAPEGAHPKLAGFSQVGNDQSVFRRGGAVWNCDRFYFVRRIAMSVVDDPAVMNLIEVLRDMVKRGTLKKSDFESAALNAKLARGVISDWEADYEVLEELIFET